MKKLSRITLLLCLTAGSLISARAQEPLFRNEEAPIEARVEDLLKRMTTDEKIDLLRATSPANERLGLEKYYHGNGSSSADIRLEK